MTRLSLISGLLLTLFLPACAHGHHAHMHSAGCGHDKERAVAYRSVSSSSIPPSVSAADTMTTYRSASSSSIPPSANAATAPTYQWVEAPAIPPSVYTAPAGTYATKTYVLPAQTYSYSSQPAPASGADTHTYMPFDNCTGRSAHSSDALVGNAAGGTRYSCSTDTVTTTTTTTTVTTTVTNGAPSGVPTIIGGGGGFGPQGPQPTYSYSAPSPHYDRSSSSSSIPPNRYDSYVTRQTGVVTDQPRQTYRYTPGVPTTRSYTIPTEPDLNGN